MKLGKFASENSAKSVTFNPFYVFKINNVPKMSKPSLPDGRAAHFRHPLRLAVFMRYQSGKKRGECSANNLLVFAQSTYPFTICIKHQDQKIEIRVMPQKEMLKNQGPGG